MRLPATAGLSPRIKQVTPDLAGDLLKSGLNGVANYVQGISNAGNLSANGGLVSVQRQVPGLLEQIGGAVAGAFSAGRSTNTIALVGLATVERESVFGIIFGI